MTDYAKNVQDFYGREDYAALAGTQSVDGLAVDFKELTYIPRKTTPLPGTMATSMLKCFAALEPQPTTLYLHIPFCNLRCSYCSFYRNPFDAEQVEAYVQALLQELDYLKQQGAFTKQKIAAVFFGGGTPSVLSPKQITTLLAKIHQAVVLTDDCELTFESSIYDLSQDKLAACLEGGINRFSFGVQAFDTQLRRSLGRLNTEAEVMHGLETVAATGVRVIIDLIYGLRGQTKEMLLADLNKALACGVSGLDLYKLQIMPKSPLGEAIAKGAVSYDYTEEGLSELFLAADELLAEQGAKPLSCCHWAMRGDERSCYNSLVKSGANVIACGAGCGGHMGVYKYMKSMDRETYIKKLQQNQYPVMGMGRLGDNYRLLDELSGQCDKGCLDFTVLASYNDADWGALLQPLLATWQELELIYTMGKKYYFTAKGKFYYRQLDRLLLTAVEYALYGKPGLLEQAGQKMMGLMKNMK